MSIAQWENPFITMILFNAKVGIFPICCNTIIHLLLLGSLLRFKINNHTVQQYCIIETTKEWAWLITQKPASFFPEAVLVMQNKAQTSLDTKCFQQVAMEFILFNRIV